MASLVVLTFWGAAIALDQFLLLPQEARGAYPGLDSWLRLLLPVVGGFLLGLIFDRLRAKHREVGIVHVLRHLHTPGKACLPAAKRCGRLQYTPGGYRLRGRGAEGTL